MKKHCKACGFENPERMKFCGQCGAPLTQACPKCGAENPAGFRFCGRCAALLAPNSTPGAGLDQQAAVSYDLKISKERRELLNGERKTITALFSDLKGSTELIEHLDPEEARAIVDPALKIMIDAVCRYEGYVAQSTGDGIFALFGAPAAHEDHPQRALHAALQMQQDLREYGRRRAREGGSALEARIGVNTGEVVVRTIETGGKVEYLPIGLTANLAARLQTVAPSGSVAISEHTRRLVEGYFELRALGPMTVKGLSEPVSVYEVIRPGTLQTHFQRSARRGLTRFVGRERELEQIKHSLELVRAGHGQIVAVVAEAGAGKSRLVYEFKAAIPPECKVLEAFSVSHGKASAWLPVLELLRGYFGIRDTDDATKRREKVRAALNALDPALSDTLPYLFGLLGIQDAPDGLAQMDPQIRRQRTLDAVRQIYLRESLNQPVVLIFEDLHWIDRETRALLDLLADSIVNARVLLLVNYRPEYHHEWANKSYYSQLRLSALEREDVGTMLSALLGDEAELDPVKRLIVERTEGNPFFIEEMMQALFDEGTLVRHGSVKVARSLSQLRLPPTVQGILASRIDRLSSKHKELLQTLAVVGRASPLRLIRRVTDEAEIDLQKMLMALRAGEFIYKQTAFLDNEYVFKHALTHEVAYNSLLIRDRKTLHDRIGQAIEGLYADRLEDHIVELAHHFQLSDNVDKASYYLRRAARQAIARAAYRDAIASLNKAKELLRNLPNGPERQRVELDLSSLFLMALQASRGYAAPEVGDLVQRLNTLSDESTDPATLFRVMYRSSQFYFVRGDLRYTRKIGEELVRRAEIIGDPGMLSMAHELLGGSLVWLGETAAARVHLERAARDNYRVASAYLGWAQWHLGYPDLARKSLDRALQYTEKISRPYTVATILGVAGVLNYLLRDHARLFELAEDLLAVAGEHEIAFYRALGAVHQGAALAGLGSLEKGLKLLTEGIGAFSATGTKLVLPYCHLVYGEALVKAGRPQDAVENADTALALIKRNGERYLESELHRLKGEALLAGSESDEIRARASFERAIQIAVNQDAKSLELRATMALARLLSCQGRRAEARTMISNIRSWFTEGFNTADLRSAAELYERLDCA
jgi:class 3 adenylate cyclase